MYFRNIILCTLVVAVVANAAFSFYQHNMVTPIILEAEKYEVIDQLGGSHGGLVSEKEVWGTEDGLERTGFTFGANFLAAFGFSVLLISGMASVGRADLLKSIFWGAAGYLVFFLAPRLGLSPEIPGMKAAALEGRQTWWVLTATMTAVGLAMLVFSDRFLKLGGLVLLVLPHVIGTPAVEIHGFAHPDEGVVRILEDLWRQFVVQTYIANALLWIIIGSLSGIMVRSYIGSLDKASCKD